MAERFEICDFRCHNNPCLSFSGTGKRDCYSAARSPLILPNFSPKGIFRVKTGLLFEPVEITELAGFQNMMMVKFEDSSRIFGIP